LFSVILADRGIMPPRRLLHQGANIESMIIRAIARRIKAVCKLA
jgi:hypothetical protein